MTLARRMTRLAKLRNARARVGRVRDSLRRYWELSDAIDRYMLPANTTEDGYTALKLLQIAELADRMEVR